jgi:8-oxo-dGTP pyrophosphatase MutT (NUDIX family)
VKLIDIFNDRYEPIGTEDKKTAHAKGLWHRTFSALAINPATQRVVLQKKAPGRYSFDRPDYADITVGGHYRAGETISDGVREFHEELGLPVAYGDLHPIGLRQTAVTLAPDYIEREFQHWHLLPMEVGLDEIPLADAEGRAPLLHRRTHTPVLVTARTCPYRSLSWRRPARRSLGRHCLLRAVHS